MSERFRPHPAEFERCVELLCTKIAAVGARSGLADSGCDELEDNLAALGAFGRARVKLMLEGAAIQSEFSDPTMALAARYLLDLAQDIWEENPRAASPPVPHTKSG